MGSAALPARGKEVLIIMKVFRRLKYRVYTYSASRSINAYQIETVSQREEITTHTNDTISRTWVRRQVQAPTSQHLLHRHLITVHYS